MGKHVSREIANSLALFVDYMDTVGTMTEEEFEEMLMCERMEALNLCFGEDDEDDEDDKDQ